MALVIRGYQIGAVRGPGAQKNEVRQDAWTERLVRGLTAVARDFPQARDALYQLLFDLAR